MYAIRSYYDEKYQFEDIESIEKTIPEYVRFRNEMKGQWARYGKTASSVLNETEAKLLTDEELEWVIRELYFEKVKRIVKQNGKVKFEGKWYHVGKKMSGENVEVKITLKGVEVWHEGAFIKGWEYVIGIDAGYMLEKYLIYVITSYSIHYTKLYETIYQSDDPAAVAKQIADEILSVL